MSDFNDINLRAFLLDLQEQEDFCEKQEKKMAELLDDIRSRLEAVRQ